MRADWMYLMILSEPQVFMRFTHISVFDTRSVMSQTANTETHILQ